MDPSRCIVLVPVAGHIESECERALVALEKRGYVVRRVAGYAAIDQGRSQMATDALAQGFDELMWIDSDVAFDPDERSEVELHGREYVLLRERDVHAVAARRVETDGTGLYL